MPALILSLLALLLVLWLLGQPWWVERQRRKIRARPFPATWRRILQKRVPYVRAMPTDLQLQLKQHMQVFLTEKAFIGCAGLTISDEMRVTIAAQACLPADPEPTGALLPWFAPDSGLPRQLCGAARPHRPKRNRPPRAPSAGG